MKKDNQKLLKFIENKGKDFYYFEYNGVYIMDNKYLISIFF